MEASRDRYFNLSQISPLKAWMDEKICFTLKQTLVYKLFSFSFLVFEIGANRFSIKFCIRKSHLFVSKMQMWYQEKQLKFFWNVLCDLQSQKWKVLEPNLFYRKLIRNRVVKQDTPFFYKQSKIETIAPKISNLLNNF